MQTQNKFWIILILTIACGVIIASVDTSPNWDDTGITVMMVFVAAAIAGFILPKYAWVWAISVGIWIPILNIFLTSNYESAIALLIAFIGAYAGVFVNKLLFGS